METQPGLTVWLTGMSRAGKSTLARHLVARLRSVGRQVELLDEDEIETLLPEPPHASRDVRDRNVRQLGEMASLLTRNGVVAVVASMSPHKEARDEIRREIGRYVEVFVDCPFELLLERDSEGTYRKALQGELQNVVGVQAPYETSPNFELVVDTSRGGVDALGIEVFEKLSSHGYLGRDESRSLIDGLPFELQVVDDDPLYGDDEEDEEGDDDDRWNRAPLRLVSNSELEGAVTSRVTKPGAPVKPRPTEAQTAAANAVVAKAGTAKAATAKAGTAKAATAKAGTPKAGTAKAATAKAGTAKAVPEKAVPAKTATVKIATAKAGTAKAGTAKAGTAEAGTAKAGTAKAATAKAGAAKAGTAKAATAKAATVKAATVKAATAKAGVADEAGVTEAGAASTVPVRAKAQRSRAAKAVESKGADGANGRQGRRLSTVAPSSGGESDEIPGNLSPKIAPMDTAARVASLPVAAKGE